MAEQPPSRVARWRARLSHRIYPYWTQTEVDAISWRAHVQRRNLGLTVCHDTDAPCPVVQKAGEVSG